MCRSSASDVIEGVRKARGSRLMRCTICRRRRLPVLHRTDITSAATIPRPMRAVATGLKKMGAYAAHASGLWSITSGVWFVTYGLW